MAAVEQEKKDQIVHLVTFRLGEGLYGIDILLVQEINRLMQITRVPNAPSFVEGVMNLRGRVIPVLDMRKRMSLPDRKMDEKNRIMVVNLSGQCAGFIVDSVEEVLRIPASIVDPPPVLSTQTETEFVKGIGRLQNNILLIILDFTKLLSFKEHEELKTVAK